MINIIVVGLGGFLGAILRYLIGLIPVQEGMLFPIKTFAINLLGCIAIGVIAAWTAKNGSVSPSLILFAKVGVCGGFTTFSTFALETTDLLQGGHAGTALLYAVLSMAAGVAVIFGTELLLSR